MVSSPFVIILSDEDRAVLTARARSARCPYRDVVRARIILAAADGTPNARIATDLELHADTVRKWRRRFAAHGLAGLKDLARSGRPRTFTAVREPRPERRTRWGSPPHVHRGPGRQHESVGVHSAC